MAPIETKPMPFNATQRLFAIALPYSPVEGQWQVKAYVNDQERKDACGISPFTVGSPYAEIVNFDVVQNKAGAAAKLQLTLKNPSALPLNGLQFEIAENRNDVYQPVTNGTVNLAAGQRLVWTADWTPACGALHELRASLLSDPAAPAAKATVVTRKEIAWSAPDPAKPVQFGVSPIAVTTEFRQTSPKVIADVKLPVYLLDGKYSGPIEIAWGWGDTAKTTETVPLRKGQTSATCHLTLESDAAELPKPFVVEVDPKHKVMKQPTEDARLDSSLDLTSLPDLTFAREKGLAVDPPHPSDAQTVFFHVPIKNRGGSDAKDFCVTAYENEPTSGGLELTSAVGNSYCEIQGLAAGAVTDAIIRWDPKKNAGDKHIYFKIDSRDHVVEQSKNNIAPYLLHVRTLAKLEQAGFDFDYSELVRLQHVSVEATVKNAGETEDKFDMIFGETAEQNSARRICWPIAAICMRHSRAPFPTSISGSTTSWSAWMKPKTASG